MPLSHLYTITSNMEVLELDSDEEQESYQSVALKNHSSIIPPETRRRFSSAHSELISERRRRRSSVRSKISIPFTPQNSKDVQLVADYTLDFSSQRTIEDFMEINILGIGSYGRVLLVKDKYNDKLYAKKTIKKARISIDEKLFKTSKNEKDILSKISHPNIVKLFYSFHDQENINFILEYIPGGEIFYHLNSRQRFDEDETSFYLAEISLALNHLHKIGVVYRDLKPENVLLNSKGHAILTDFGLSSTEETCNSILGTPQFTAPEVLKGESYSYPADWWSFGIMMFDMLTGSIPFDGNTRDKIFDKIVKKKIQLPHYLSLDAKDLLTRLTNKNPSKRLQIDSDFNKLSKHRFFRKINWEKINELDPPIKPDISDLESANNFDHDYINEIIKNEDIKEGNIKNINDKSFDNSMFKGFSFIASESVFINE